MSPVLTDGNAVGQGIHGIEDHQVGVTEQFDETAYVLGLFGLVFCIGGVHDHLAVALEPVTVGMTTMQLQPGHDLVAGNLVVSFRFQRDEFNVRIQLGKMDRKAGLVLLAAKGEL